MLIFLSGFALPIWAQSFLNVNLEFYVPQTIVDTIIFILRPFMPVWSWKKIRLKILFNVEIVIIQQSYSLTLETTQMYLLWCALSHWIRNVSYMTAYHWISDNQSMSVKASMWIWRLYCLVISLQLFFLSVFVHGHLTPAWSLNTDTYQELQQFLFYGARRFCKSLDNTLQCFAIRSGAEATRFVFPYLYLVIFFSEFDIFCLAHGSIVLYLPANLVLTVLKNTQCLHNGYS